MRPVLLRFAFMALIMSAATWLGAQFTVSGTVLDDQGEPLIGANVLIKGAAEGTVTDFDGKFSLQISGDEATLIFSYTGFNPKEIVVNRSTTTLTVTLSTSATTLEEVVVVGYGTQRKEALTGSVTSLSSEDIEQVPFASAEQALQGGVAGLQANMGNGQPGSQVEVRIRGQGSISASSDPLYVVDGIPIFNPGDALTNQSETANTLANLNPNDIETLTVLKDASATAIYGARAANGVVLITTKSGRSGKPKVNLNVQYGLNDWAIADDNQFRGLTALEYADLYIEGELNRGRSLEDAIDRFNGQYPDPITGLPAVDIIADGSGGYSFGEVRVDTRWVEEITRTGNNQSYNLSVSGGNESVNYYASGGYFDQESPIIGTGFDRYSTRINVGAQANDWLHISNNISIART
ncbi:MAG: SusC/RagA family TonB-linked outer membrane protein, partial [Saprospiraceae bacterium]|nr:SusC/RagA family TonB-linked outer membrane protein [Saprospiraceae bacterium]